MNREVIACVAGVGAGLLAGVSLAWGEAIRRSERAAKARYEEQLQSHIRAMNFRESLLDHFDIDANRYASEDLADQSEDAIKVGGEMTVETPIASPDYIAAAARYSSPTSFVDKTAPQSIAYIEEEDYQEDDGRAKEEIVILMGGDSDSPLFFMDGQAIDDWAERIGDSILTDFYRMTPPGKERVLYLRNHQRDEDYEVTQEFP